MTLQYDRIRDVADAVALVASKVTCLMEDVNKIIEYDADQVVGWTPAGKTSTVANATDIFTSTAHGFLVDQKLRFTNSGGALPAGLLANPDYWVIAANLAANTFQVSTTKGGAALNVTTDGTGTTTAFPIP